VKYSERRELRMTFIVRLVSEVNERDNVKILLARTPYIVHNVFFKFCSA